MSVSVLETFRDSKRLLKSAARLMLFFFTFNLYSPVAYALANEVEQSVARQNSSAGLETLEAKLIALKQQVRQEKASLKQRLQDNSNWLDRLSRMAGITSNQANLASMGALFEGIESDHLFALSDFDRVKEHLIESGVTQTILQRHDQAVAEYKAKFLKLQAGVKTLEQAESLEEQDAALDEIEKHLNRQKLQRTFTPENPNDLPWSIPDAAKTRKPAESPQDLSNQTGISLLPEGMRVASNMVALDMLGIPGGPVPEDLAASPDVQLSEAIKSKARELNNDPVKIYNWVRNNILFIPSYGSIQGAEFTLNALQGNAFDTASLLIALLRAANVPARYAYGTVEVPAEQVSNWVGGVDLPQAAQQLLGQGGIPNIALVEGGTIKHIRLEHIWVEAWIDYLPSRGAKHIAGDQWIPLDASFKQYEFKQGADLQEELPFDAEGLFQQVQQTSVGGEPGYVQGVDRDVIRTAINDYQARVEEYLRTQNPEASISDFFGEKKMIVQEFRELAAGLPYILKARTHNYSVLPNSLRHKFRYTISTENYGQEGSRLITLEKSLPELAGKQLLLSFKPAAQADRDLINSYLPKPDPATGEVDITKMPKTLPGYLINMTAELKLDGAVVQAAVAGTMGKELYETLALWSPTSGWQQAVNHPVAGEHRAIALNLQGATGFEASQQSRKFKKLEDALDSDDSSQLDGFSASGTVGEILYSTIFSYMAMNDVQNRLQANTLNLVNYRLPSYGIFSTGLQTSYWYGMPRNVSLDGLVMDVDHLSMQVVSVDNDPVKSRDYMNKSGAMSSILENLIPEIMFSTDSTKAEGASAVKALMLANDQGQRIWNVDSSNVHEALAAIRLSVDVENEIRNAVSAGKVATVHESPVAFAGTTVVGYILLDPATGAGAYKVGGGQNGGILKTIDSALETMIGWITAVEESLGDAKYLLKPVKKLVGQVKRFLENMRAIISIIENCNAGAALLGVVLLVLMIWVMAKVMAFMTAMITILCGAFSGPAVPVCIVTGSILVLSVVVDFANSMIQSTTDTILDGWLCKVGT